MDRLDLSPFKYVDVNITGFRLVDPETEQVEAYLKKWNWKFAGIDGRGRNHPLFVRLVQMKKLISAAA